MIGIHKVYKQGQESRRYDVVSKFVGVGERGGGGKKVLEGSNCIDTKGQLRIYIYMYIVIWGHQVSVAFLKKKN